MSAVELSGSGTFLACIYRSSDSDFYEFLVYKLELLITKVHSKGKRLIFCGDLNINFFTIQRKASRITKFISDE
jgi:hypothetical protein